MGIKFGTIDITNLFFGSKQIEKAYFGNTLVFESGRSDLFAKWIEDRLTTITESDLAGVTNITYGAFSSLTKLTSINFPSTVQSFTIYWSSQGTSDCGISSCVPPRIIINFSSSGTYYQTYNGVTYKMESGVRKYVEYININQSTIQLDTNAIGFGKNIESMFYRPESSNITTFIFSRNFTADTFYNSNPLRNLSALQYISVDSNNTNLRVLNGGLYSYDGTKLYAVPRKRSTLIIANGTTEIISYCADSSNLTSVTIPTSVTTISAGAFAHCTSLTSVTYQGTMSEWASVSLNSAWHTGSAFTVVHCSDGDVTL